MILEYTNPVWAGYMADPFVLRHEGVYFAYGTGGPVAHGRQADGSFYPVLRSVDLVNWTYLGGALQPLNLDGVTDYWAPEVAARDGKFYLYYSAGRNDGWGHQVRVAVADYPDGPFRDAGKVLMPAEPFSIDPHPFCDPKDGKWYLFFAKDFFDGRAGTGTAVVALGDDMMSVAGEVKTVVRAQSDWQIFQRNRHWYGKMWEAWHTVEGPFVLYRDGKYYCLYSGGCWETQDYGVGFGVAEQVMGPYVDVMDGAGPFVLRGVAGKIFGPGHNSVVTGPGEQVGEKREFIVYHAWNGDRTVRHLCIDRLEWTAEGPRCVGPTCTPQRVES